MRLQGDEKSDVVMGVEPGQGRSHQVRFGGGTKSKKNFLHVPPNFGIFGGPNDLSLYRPKDV